MHIPVLLDEVIKYLDPKKNENFIDATFGAGGHAAAILKKIGPTGRLLGIEADTELYKKSKSRIAEFPISNFQFPNRLILVNDSYANLKRIVEERKFGPVNGILFDLGMSSWHLEESGRGFSFQKNEPLIMRYFLNPGVLNPKSQILNPKQIPNSKIQNFKLRNDLTAEEIVNQWPESKLENIFREYGEERWSKRIARKIVEGRRIKPIKTTFELVEIIKKAAPRSCKKGRHPATRVFQALRIVANDELENLKIGLRQTLEILAPGGRIAVISFHSGEDRIVKNFFRDEAKKGIMEILTKKPIIPTSEEIRRNSRARSAKLRAAKINSAGINFNTELRIEN